MDGVGYRKRQVSVGVDSGLVWPTPNPTLCHPYNCTWSWFNNEQRISDGPHQGWGMNQKDVLFIPIKVFLIQVKNMIIKIFQKHIIIIIVKLVSHRYGISFLKHRWASQCNMRMPKSKDSRSYNDYFNETRLRMILMKMIMRCQYLVLWEDMALLTIKIKMKYMTNLMAIWDIYDSAI